MFCSECGAKNEKTNDFCSECGAPLKKEELPPKENTKQPMSKSKKILIGFFIIIIILLGIGYKIGKDITDPKTVAKEYIQAVIDQDGDKLYQYLEIDGDTTFTTKKIFSELIKEEEDIDVVNYKITNVDYGEGKLSAKVSFTYMLEDSTEEETSYINLSKQKNKKYFFFDNWKISDFSSSSILVKDYTIKVNKGSSITFAGVKVSDKYLDSKQSTSKLDVYVLPQVFAYETELKTILPSGMPIEEKILPSTYDDSYRVGFEKDVLTEAEKEVLIKNAKENFTTIYQNAIAKKSFNDIKTSFEHDGIDLTEFEKEYTELVSDLESNYRKLTEIEFSKIEIEDIELDEDGYLEVQFLLNYNYTIQYTGWYSNETQTSKDTDYGYMKMKFTYDNGKYYLVSVDDLETYFY